MRHARLLIKRHELLYSIRLMKLSQPMRLILFFLMISIHFTLSLKKLVNPVRLLLMELGLIIGGRNNSAEKAIDIVSLFPSSNFIYDPNIFWDHVNLLLNYQY